MHLGRGYEGIKKQEIEKIRRKWRVESEERSETLKCIESKNKQALA